MKMPHIRPSGCSHLVSLSVHCKTWSVRFSRGNSNNKRDALCREIEHEYGLTVDNGMEKERGQRNERAIALEAQQGVQSFDSYVRERAASILAVLDAAKSWQDLHKELHRHGLEIRPKGNGLIIKSRHGKQALKASDMDRRLSKSRLEKVLGAYQPPMPILVKEESRYRNRPVQRSPAGEALHTRYQAEAASGSSRPKRRKPVRPRLWPTYAKNGDSSGQKLRNPPCSSRTGVI